MYHCIKAIHAFCWILHLLAPFSCPPHIFLTLVLYYIYVLASRLQQMRFWTSGYTLLGAILLHIALASSYSWSPVQTQSEDIEYDPQQRPRPFSALEVLHIISPVIEKGRGDTYGEEEDNLGRLHRFAAVLL